MNSTSTAPFGSSSAPAGWFHQNEKRVGGSTASTSTGPPWSLAEAQVAPGAGFGHQSTSAANHWAIWRGSVIVLTPPGRGFDQDVPFDLVPGDGHVDVLSGRPLGSGHLDVQPTVARRFDDLQQMVADGGFARPLGTLAGLHFAPTAERCRAMPPQAAFRDRVRATNEAIKGRRAVRRLVDAGHLPAGLEPRPHGSSAPSEPPPTHQRR
ncbi:MAG: hypothetical protein R2761_28065 [Acidimicrobiales bacterium]